MSFNTYFRASSYCMIAVALVTLVLAGALHWSLALVFSAAMMMGWRIEGTRWQLSERMGLILVLVSMPIFYFDWTYQSNYLRLTTNAEWQTKALVAAIAHLIVILSVIKLLQLKSDRDWVFLYLISFFEVLLAAGLSFSPLFLVSLSLYLVCSISTVIAFEIYKAKRSSAAVETRLLVAPDSHVFRRPARRSGVRCTETRRLPIMSVAFLVLIIVLALPLFLVAPRAGAAAFSRRGSGLTNFIGFSENVQLGEIGTLKENNQVVMHVRVEDSLDGHERDLRWRGVALDEFTGRGWKKSLESRRSPRQDPEQERGIFKIDTIEAVRPLTTQTVFLEPLDTPVVFGAPRVIALQGPFPFVHLDSEGSLQSRRHEFERWIYKVVSDTTQPDPEILRRDLRRTSVSAARYTQLPASLDPRIGDLARAMITKEDARNSYDRAKAIESQLRSDYGYTLEMKAAGPDPLSDFLFNIRAGHCEYFSTAMAVMLRTQNIPARVVNGFLSGEYNDAAGAFTVRQSDAHSWVEVYFPATNSWVTFDPTPAAGRTEPQHTGLSGLVGKYAEAFELMWFQYVIGYDKQEQRSLAASLNNRLFRYRKTIADSLAAVKRVPAILWQRVLVFALTLGFAFLTFLLIRRVRHLGWRRALSASSAPDKTGSSAVEFYERLTQLLAQRGLNRSPDQTPMEFATGLGRIEVVGITKAYNRVRYGDQRLSEAERGQIHEALTALERETAAGTQRGRIDPT